MLNQCHNKASFCNDSMHTGPCGHCATSQAAAGHAQVQGKVNSIPSSTLHPTSQLNLVTVCIQAWPRPCAPHHNSPAAAGHVQGKVM